MLLYKIAEKVYELENQGRNVVKMNVGELDFDTPKNIVEAGIKALQDGRTRYGSAAGELSLREKIAKMHGVESSNVAITVGSKWGIYSLINILCRKKRVLGLSPGWPTFESMSKHFDAQFEWLSLKMENQWKPDVDEFSNVVKGKSLVILNNPSNPTSQVWDDDVEEKLVEIAQKAKVPMLLDTAYRDLCFEKKQEVQWKDGMIICGSFSKSLAMTGWRVGYIVADKEIIGRYVKINQMSITCVPKFIQLAALVGLDNKDNIADKFRNECKKRADAAIKVFSDAGIDCVAPGAGFYVFPKLPCKDAFDSCMKLLNKHAIAIVPGSVFGAYKEHVRISLCYSPKIIEESIEKLRDVVKKC